MSADAARFLGFAFANADVLVEVTTAGTISFVAGALGTICNLREQDVIGKPLDRLVGTADVGLVRRLLGTLKPNSRLETRRVGLRRGDQTVTATMSGYRLGASPTLHLTFTMVSGIAAVVPEVPRDQETGLVEADAFQAELCEKFGIESDGGPPKLTLLKIAGLGEVRSRLGPEVTARLLEEVGGLLRVHAASDTLATRLGDDRFGIVHGKDTDGKAIAADIEAAGQRIAPGGPSLRAQQTSLDLASPGLGREDAGRVLLFAVRRFAEDESGHSIATIGEALRDLVDQTVTKVTNLRSTLVNQHLRLQFQPIVFLPHRGLHHYEALARFPDAAPGPTIAFAEEIGMVQEVDLLVCHKALSILMADSGQPPLQIAINLSAVSLGSDIFMATFARILQKHPQLRQRMLIEITESSEIKDLERAARIINDLRAAGHSVCLDDFGAGAASFPYIQALKVDFVKIDGSYVKSVGRNPRNDAILRAIVNLCDDIGVQVIAEMVETQEQATQLANWGVKLAQGYLFGRPVDQPDYQVTALAAAGAAPRPR
ncbi:EAL domain-containing protein [Azospirillum sp. SYSU D00513]|uniref:EAL domain-containing protein n=1 Tax=Azospirillum sp. SYSU D00513 TaxID=2812561 RepID=UPI001A95A6C1|nr:EAL domain-containing protein [Azospirillum sp. SYSU D00513]